MFEQIPKIHMKKKNKSAFKFFTVSRYVGIEGTKKSYFLIHGGERGS